MRLDVGGVLSRLINAAGCVILALAFLFLARMVEPHRLWVQGFGYPVLWFCSMMSLILLLIGMLCFLTDRPPHRLPFWLILGWWIIVIFTLLFGLIAEDYNAISSYEKDIGQFTHDLIINRHWNNDQAIRMRAALEWFAFVVLFGLTLLLVRLAGVGRPTDRELQQRADKEQT
jgi:hypothetical protein